MHILHLISIFIVLVLGSITLYMWYLNYLPLHSEQCMVHPAYTVPEQATDEYGYWIIRSPVTFTDVGRKQNACVPVSDAICTTRWEDVASADTLIIDHTTIFQLSGVSLCRPKRMYIKENVHVFFILSPDVTYSIVDVSIIILLTGAQLTYIPNWYDIDGDAPSHPNAIIVKFHRIYGCSISPSASESKLLAQAQMVYGQLFVNKLLYVDMYVNADDVALNELLASTYTLKSKIKYLSKQCSAECETEIQRLKDELHILQSTIHGSYSGATAKVSTIGWSIFDLLSECVVHDDVRQLLSSDPCS